MPGDCCECGACCFSQSDAYVAVTEDDILRMGPVSQQAVSQVDGRHYLTMSQGRCAHLEHVEGDWVCSIYSMRPKACRELQRGSPECLAERAIKKRRATREAKSLAE